MSATELSNSEAERLRAFERQGHDALAKSYHAFFSSVTALATNPLFDAVRLRAGTRLLDVASGPGALAAEAADRGARSVGVDLSPRMIELAQRCTLESNFVKQMSNICHFPIVRSTQSSALSDLDIFPTRNLLSQSAYEPCRPEDALHLAWWQDPSRQRIQGIFREAIAEIGVSVPPDVPQGHDVFRFSNSGEFLRLLEGAGLSNGAVRELEATYFVPDTETLWRGGLGSLVLTGAVIRHQDQATHDLIRTAFERKRQHLQISRWTEPADRIHDRLRPAVILIDRSSLGPRGRCEGSGRAVRSCAESRRNDTTG